jgi:hypothetical protein
LLQIPMKDNGIWVAFCVSELPRHVKTIFAPGHYDSSSVDQVHHNIKLPGGLSGLVSVFEFMPLHV